MSRNLTNISLNHADISISTTTTSNMLDDNLHNILIIAGITATLILMSFLRALFISLFTHHASRDLHNAMFTKLLRAPIWFFERNPVGRCWMYTIVIYILLQRVSSSSQKFRVTVTFRHTSMQNNSSLAIILVPTRCSQVSLMYQLTCLRCHDMSNVSLPFGMSLSVHHDYSYRLNAQIQWKHWIWFGCWPVEKVIFCW